MRICIRTADGAAAFDHCDRIKKLLLPDHKIKDKFMIKLICKQKEALWQYSVNLLLMLVFWGGYLRKNFNGDTVFHMVVDDADVMTRIEEGRYVVALGDFLLLKLGLRTTSNLSITMLITILILAMAMCLLQDLFKRWMPDAPWEKAGFYLGLNLVFMNVLFSEIFMFGESSLYFAIAYWTALLGIKCYIHKKYLFMFIMLGIAASSYQNAVVFAAIILSFYIFMDEELILSWRAVTREIAGVAICMGMGLFNFLSVKLLERLNERISFSKYPGIGDWTDKLSDAFEHYIKLNRSSDGIFPNLWFPLVFTVILWSLMVYSCIKNRNLSRLLFLFLVWAGDNILLYVIPMLQVGFNFPPRLSFCFFLIQGLLLAASYKINIDFLKRIAALGGIFYLMIHLLFAGFIMEDRFSSNVLDEVYVKMMYEEILRYENETGIIVTKLAVIKDINAPDSYEEITYATGQINERVLGTASRSLVQIVTNRSFEWIEMPQSVYDQYFKDKNWDYINLDQQLVIQEDEAYWCIF